MLQGNVLQISPDNPNHRKLEDDVVDYLESKGYKTFSQPYHEVLGSGVVRILSNRYDPTALYLRARADRTAIHLSKCIQFEFDAKTHENKKYKDMTLELYPSVLHLRKARLGIKCLYCYRDPYLNIDKGFWFDEFPNVRSVTIPPAQRMNHLRDWFKKMVSYYFPDISIYEPGYKQNGSGDPYLIIDYHEILKMKHWKELIDEVTNA